MKEARIRWKEYLRILLLIVLLYMFYRLGLPLYFIILMGIVLLLFILLKEEFYGKLDNFLSKKFPFLSKLKPWVRKLIILAIFILIYMLLKQVIFLGLRIAGVDIQNIITESINNSMT
ncbi:MAG: hypothetical protein PHG05_00050 [Candidatus Nanoarchaeia archaeon]|nr:hypothetical protein [Candidatus Nanoarchaeia archaeon]